jgi:pimeloyl-ACP methyl ester carboxylesterase
MSGGADGRSWTVVRVAWLALACAGVFGAYLAVLFLAQRSMLFPIPAYVPEDPDADAEIVQIKGFDTEASGLFLAPRAAAGRAPLMIFMHGNGELADDWVRGFEPPRKWGVAVLLVEYPGYGRAPGAPSEKSIMEAVRAAYDWATADPRIDPNRIVAYGRSLGGGAAARLAVDRKVAVLILESAFTSVADFAARFVAPAFLIRDRFDNRKTLASYRGPLLMFHGRLDTIVPIAHGRELVALVPGARLEELNCGHNDCPRQWDTIEAFLRDAGVIYRRQEGSKD